MPNRRPLAALLLAGLIALSGCSTGPQMDDPSQDSDGTGDSPLEGAPGEPDLPEADVADVPDVVAEVNGEEIGKEEFIATYEGQLQQMSLMQQGQEIDQAELKMMVADQLVNNLVLVQAAQRSGITATDEEVEAALEELGAQNGLGSVDEVLEAFKSQGIAEDLVREDAAAQVQINAYLEQEIATEEPSEESLEQQYEELVDMLEAQEGEGADGEIPAFDEVRDLILEQTLQEQRNAELERIVSDLLAEADITIHL